MPLSSSSATTAAATSSRKINGSYDEAQKRKRPRTHITSQATDDEEKVLAALLGTGTVGRSGDGGGSAIGGLQDMETYEQNVIRQAELASTPRLLLQSQSDLGSSNENDGTNEDQIFLGFPSLFELVPSGAGGRTNDSKANAAMSDVPHVRHVLENLRKKSSSGKGREHHARSNYLTNNMDCLKEQVLLSLLHSVTGDHELCVRPQHEMKQEIERQQLFRHRVEECDETETGENYHRGENQDGEIAASGLSGSVMPETKQLKSALKKQSAATDTIDLAGCRLNTPTDRLEAIKRGEERVVRFASEPDSQQSSSSAVAAILLPQPKRRYTRRRKSLQERRQEDGRPDHAQFDTSTMGNSGSNLRRHRASGTSPSDTGDDDEEEIVEEIETEESLRRRRERLREIRKERESRRRLKRGYTRSKKGLKRRRSSDSHSNDKSTKKKAVKQQTGENCTTKLTTESKEGGGGEDELGQNHNSFPVPHDDDVGLGREVEECNAVVLPAEADVPTTSVKKEDLDDSNAMIETNFMSRSCILCPLCQKSLQLPESSATQHDDDAFLAEHMNTCQQTLNGRPSRRRCRSEKLLSATDNNSSNVNTTDSWSMKGKDDKKKKCTSTVGYVDMNEFDDDADDDSHGEHESNDDSDEFVEDESGDAIDDDEIEIGTLESDSENNSQRKRPASRAHSKKTNSRQARGLQRNSSSAPQPVDDWNEEDFEDRVDEWIENGLDRMKTMKEQDADESPPGEVVYDGGLVVPAWINDRLFPYQRTGLQWMWELHRQQSGGVLGDEMGLGKTVQVASFLGSMAASRKLKTILIIAPATMLQHWLRELAVWAPGIRRILIHQSGEGAQNLLPSSMVRKRNITHQRLASLDQWLKESRKNRLYEMIDEDDLESREPHSFCGTAVCFVTTYENIRRNDNIWTRHKWSYVVMDEAQKIKNATADITVVCKRFRTPHRLAMSGTPIQNDLRELWSLFDFVFPGRLGTLPAFENEFAEPIKRGGYANASQMQVQLAYRTALILKDLINPYLLRRLKKDIKEVQRMPGKREQVLFCRLSDQQRTMYESFLKSDHVRSVLRGTAQLLGAITVMRKICNHPDLICRPDKASVESFLRDGIVSAGKFVQSDPYDSSDQDDEEDGYDDEIGDDFDMDGRNSVVSRSGKMEVLAKILPIWKKNGHRVLIFCQWKKMLDIIQRFTELQGWKFGRLDGNTNVASRQRLVDTFNSDQTYFGLLCTTRTGGVGLNLTGADRIILYDPDWNPQSDAQARERAWRFGQEREVTVYRLISAGTVEEKIYQRQIFKTALSNRVLQDPRQRRLFSQKDLKDLFTLKADSGSIATGSEGVTDTTRLTKGAGYVDPDESNDDDNDDDGRNGEKETMQNVLRSQGLAGIFDHGVIEESITNKPASVLEMEARAKRIAQDALRSLEESVAGQNPYFSSDTVGSRFGGGGVGGSDGGSGALLAAITKRNQEIQKAVSPNGTGEGKTYAKLLRDIKDFVKTKLPTTDEILQEFASRFEGKDATDASVLRSLLKSVASFQAGRWRLK